MLFIGLATFTQARQRQVWQVTRNKERVKGLEGKVFSDLKAAFRDSGSSRRSMDFVKPGATIIVHGGTERPTGIPAAITTTCCTSGRIPRQTTGRT